MASTLESTGTMALSIPEVVHEAKQCRDKIYGAIKRGDLRAKRSGRRTLVLRRDLEAYLENLPNVQL